ncbi:uncharacterized protein LOC128765339 [Synchiropus splendidus]|uniref:uncharacterized protein LOC128765339 n=1 Tax=Synchiropus splendidus TaxID=270530 RepID=UPI00237E37D7|nr:uncharacterized protein LOC128765339 [Synchiropus splendidus]
MANHDGFPSGSDPESTHNQDTTPHLIDQSASPTRMFLSHLFDNVSEEDVVQVYDPSINENMESIFFGEREDNRILNMVPASSREGRADTSLDNGDRLERFVDNLQTTDSGTTALDPLVDVSDSNCSDDNVDDDGDSLQEGCCIRGTGIESEVIEPFNTDRIRRVLTRPAVPDTPDLATFYRGWMQQVRELADEAQRLADREDVVQLEVVGEDVQEHVNVVVEGDGGNIYPAFEDLLSNTVQSDRVIAMGKRIELTVQIVHIPRGGAKRKLEKTLDAKIFVKKRRHLYVVGGDGTKQLCVAISLSCLLNPNRAYQDCVELGRELLNKAGLDSQTPIIFTDIPLFERINY